MGTSESGLGQVDFDVAFRIGLWTSGSRYVARNCNSEILFTGSSCHQDVSMAFVAEAIAALQAI